MAAQAPPAALPQPCADDIERDAGLHAERVRRNVAPLAPRGGRPRSRPSGRGWTMPPHAIWPNRLSSASTARSIGCIAQSRPVFDKALPKPDDAAEKASITVKPSSDGLRDEQAAIIGAEIDVRHRPAGTAPGYRAACRREDAPRSRFAESRPRANPSRANPRRDSPPRSWSGSLPAVLSSTPMTVLLVLLCSSGSAHAAGTWVARC